MNPPPGPIRTELSEAVVGGIRQRGPEAVGLVLVGGARLLVLFAAVLLMQLVGAELQPLSTPFSGL